MDTKQLEAIRIAEWLEGIRGNTWPSYIPQEAAAELRRLQSENEQLRAGYDAARLEIASLRAQLEAVATPAQPLHVAATSCPHEIDKDKIVLHFDSKQPGKNALAQLAARLQAAQAQEDVPDMFWDADDTENFAHEIQDIIDGYGPGEIVTIECAKWLPNFRVVVTRDGDGVSYEHSAAQQGELT